jgi:hypothetical protein
VTADVGRYVLGVSVDALREFLFALPVGPVADGRLVDVLAGAWDRLDRDDRRMAAFKLNRVEEPHWGGSVLTFAVERHGGTVLGSTRAEVQQWEVDPRAATARVVRSTHRQLHSMAARLDVRPLAEEVAALILAGANDDRLKWSADRATVKVQIGRIIPADSAARQTVTGRRRRFRAALDDELAGCWAGSSWKYARPASP